MAIIRVSANFLVLLYEIHTQTWNAAEVRLGANRR
jgi:hypothetical protein